jgi:hypothetical protein
VNDEARVSLFSVWRLGLPPRGPATERVIANLLAGCLAGALGRVEVHERGPKQCPMYFNPERSLDVLQGRMQFDKQCRTKLAASVPHLVPDLDAILGVFHTTATTPVAPPPTAPPATTAWGGPGGPMRAAVRAFHRDAPGKIRKLDAIRRKLLPGTAGLGFGRWLQTASDDQLRQFMHTAGIPMPVGW